MANLNNKAPQASKTNSAEVRAQNQRSAQSQGGYAAANNASFEFASETNAQEVRQQNAQSMAKKAQNSGANQSQTQQ